MATCDGGGVKKTQKDAKTWRKLNLLRSPLGKFARDKYKKFPYIWEFFAFVLIGALIREVDWFLVFF